MKCPFRVHWVQPVAIKGKFVRELQPNSHFCTEKTAWPGENRLRRIKIAAVELEIGVTKAREGASCRLRRGPQGADLVQRPGSTTCNASEGASCRLLRARNQESREPGFRTSWRFTHAQGAGSAT